MPLGFGLMAVQIYLNSYEKQLHRITLIIVGLLLSLGGITDMFFEMIPALYIGYLLLLSHCSMVHLFL
ncbi:hypothetical protein Ct9H90mP29_09870 [bacterium]|nr:MAG: hypothetical protein Ct9H90mP29_09870 [bacterium]